MKRILTSTIVSGVFVLGMSALWAAPQEPQRDDQGFYQNRETFFHGDNWHTRMFDRVREDLDRVQSVAFTGGDEYRIGRTKQELTDLQTKMVAGSYNEPELDSVIGALGKVVADNRLSARDREILNDDLSRMRDYREHHDNWR